MMEMTELQQSTTLFLYSERQHINIEPEYQRMGDIWTVEKRQLLIDSIINGFDIPKIYLHRPSKPFLNNNIPIKYSIIDGRQRLEAIWKFIDGDYPLSDDFCFLDNESKNVGALTYSELGTNFPDRKLKFDAFRLSVMVIQTDDLELIEDMFSRLNEAVPLNAPEKRNAFGGPLPEVIRSIARHNFFTKHLPFPNSRYRHYDLATKFLFLEQRNALVDTKKVYLDRFVANAPNSQSLSAIRKQTQKTLSLMSKVFTERDPLLKSIGSVVLYYFLFRTAFKEDWHQELSRQALNNFEQRRSENRRIAQTNLPDADYDLLEFDRYIQAPNDAYALRIRFSILLKEVFGRSWDVLAGTQQEVTS